MVDVKHTTCEFLNCETRPVYGVKGSKNARFCVNHKEIGMVDVKSKTCEFLNCETIPVYGLPGFQRSRCSKHKEVGMIVGSNSKCRFSNCKEKALYGVNFKPIHCETHKTEEDLIISKPKYNLGDSSK